MIQAETLDAEFECLYPGEALVYRLLLENGTEVDSALPEPDSPVVLTISALPQYNNSIVQCEVIIQDGEEIMAKLSCPALLTVQGSNKRLCDRRIKINFIYVGPLMAVQIEILVRPSSVKIMWDRPFSLNLTSAEPDIQYCVNVYVVTGPLKHQVLQSVCDITDTYYIFTTTVGPDQLSNFTVTPRSNVEGSLNGTTSLPVQGYTMQGMHIC